MSAAIEALRAALAAGPTPGPCKANRDEVWIGRFRLCPRVTAGASLPLCDDLLRGRINAAYIAAACNAAPELLAEVDRLGNELETERMRLAACSVAAMADTPASAEVAREALPIYKSAAFDDVCRRVDECIALRDEVDRLKAEREALRAELDRMK